MKIQASAEKSHKNLLAQLLDLGKKMDEANLTLGDYEGYKRRLTGENAELLSHLQVCTFLLNGLSRKIKFLLWKIGIFLYLSLF